MAQPIVESVNRASGLPSDYINGVYQDRYGFMWFATDAGLARYDGQQVETFTADDGLPHPFVYTVREDAEGTLWAGTFEGLARFDGARFHRVMEPFGEPLITRLHVDQEGRLVVLAEGRVARREGDRWRSVQGPVLSQAEIHSVASLSGGRLLGGGRGRLFLLEPEGDHFVARAIASGWNQGGVMHVADGDLDHAWVYGPTSNPFFYRIRVEEGRIVRVDSADIGGIRQFVPDGEGGAMLVMDRGVYRMSPDLKPEAKPIYTGQVEDLTFDYEGSLWIGTFGRGAVRRVGDHLKALTDSPAARIAVGPQGDVWASGFGLWQIDAGALRATRRFASLQFREIHFSALGTLWLSSGQILYAVEERERLAPFRADPGWISGVDVVGDSIRMSSYSAGIHRIVSGKDVDTLRAGRGLPTDMIEGLERTTSGLWALTRSHGAFRIEGGRAVRYGRREGLPSSSVYSIYTDSEGGTWFGTDRGVARLSRGAAQAEALGVSLLDGQRVSAIFERDGDVWIVGDRALYIVSQGEVQSVGAFRILPDVTSAINDVVYHAATDRLFLATTEGVVAVELAALPVGMQPLPRIAIRSVEVGETPRPLLGNPLVAHIEDIAPGRHRVEVVFAPLSFAGRVRTEVRLNGGEWGPVGEERRIVFPALGAGTYRLEVRAVSLSGGLSPESATLEFAIDPYWWQRPGFIVVLGLLSLVGLVLLVRYISQRRLREQVRALEVQRRLHDERERISRDLHDHVGAQLSSLLAGVELARLERRASGDGAPPARDLASSEALDGVEADARTTMRQLRETIWALHGSSVSMDEFASRVRNDLAARRTDLTTRVTCVEGKDQTLSPIQALNLFRVTQEAITNVLKHAEARQLEVTLAHDGASVRVEICDDGVFRPSPGGSGTNGLAGFGLRSMQARAEQLGGQLELDTSEGTTVRVVVPAESVDVP